MLLLYVHDWDNPLIGPLNPLAAFLVVHYASLEFINRGVAPCSLNNHAFKLGFAIIHTHQFFSHLTATTPISPPF
jgi:hypothetical protein